MVSVGKTTIADLWIDGVNDVEHHLPREQLRHARQENLFPSLTAFAVELAVGKCQLMSHDELRP